MLLFALFVMLVVLLAAIFVTNHQTTEDLRNVQNAIQESNATLKAILEAERLRDAFSNTESDVDETLKKGFGCLLAVASQIRDGERGGESDNSRLTAALDRMHWALSGFEGENT